MGRTEKTGTEATIASPLGPVTPSPDSGCVTVSGGTIGVKCVFPFKYNGKEYQGCTVADVSDGKLWCSTSTDRNGNHIGGGGFWGHCPSRNCQTDQNGTPIETGPTPTPVNCQWSNWGICSETCGVGSQTRTIQVQAQNGGIECSGVPIQECNLQLCPTFPFQNNKADVFKCSWGNIPIFLQCDGTNNCGDNSDEEDCNKVTTDAATIFDQE